ncbi:hypothetical protein Avbf_12271 [Armadillidium vulgare]|nr:hypothetical protein Avbf_12271 [Armadillidium vulgare]
MWLKLDGYPALFARDTSIWFNTKYPLRWIGWGGIVTRPPRSPDLTTFDFFAWDSIKGVVYANPDNDVRNLRKYEDLILVSYYPHCYKGHAQN